MGSTGDEQFLVEYLRDREERCPLCGYNLRALQSSRCPECGRELTLSVGLVEPHMTTWVVGAGAWCLCAGIGLLWLFAVAAHGMPPSGDAPVVFGFIGTIPLAIGSLVLRRRIMRTSRSAQRVLAWVSVGCAIGLFAWIAFKFIR